MEDAAAQLEALCSLEGDAVAAGDAALLAEIAAEAAALAGRLRRVARRARLDGPHDERGAVLVIEPAGGSAAWDWPGEIARMYGRWAERQGGEAHVVKRQEDMDGQSRVILELPQRFAYGLLADEAGVHALEETDPNRGAHAGRPVRARARVMVLPEAGEDELPGVEDEVVIRLVRHGHGVSCHGPRCHAWIEHPPTRLWVPCEDGHEGRQRAMAVIRAHVLGRALRVTEGRALDRDAPPIRTYTCARGARGARGVRGEAAPEVEDHRTGAHAPVTAAVLDGDLDDFLDAALRRRDVTGRQA